MTKQLQQVIARLHDARKTGASSWMARCPAHDDRRASLSVSDGRTGVRLHCFASCEFSDIVRALGLDVSQLFYESRSTSTRRHVAGVTVRDVKRALAEEAQRVRGELAQRGVAGELLVSEINAIRSRVASRMGATLPPIATPLCEGAYGGRERDGLWAPVLEHAWQHVWISRVGVRPLPLEAYATRGLCVPRGMFIAAEDVAGKMMRICERRARRAPVRLAA